MQLHTYAAWAFGRYGNREKYVDVPVQAQPAVIRQLPLICLFHLSIEGQFSEFSVLA